MDIEHELHKIKERNRRVEIDKRWEGSLARKITIVIITYGFAVWWLDVINERDIFLKAVVPVVGYLLSTISIPIVRRVWQKRNGYLK